MNIVHDPPDSALQERDRLVEHLTELIKSVTDEELQYIAEANLNSTPFQTRKQEAGLRTIIFKRHGRMTEKHVFFPGEVLSIIAEDGEEHLDRSFEIATAILMINALLSDDEDGAMSLCWAENAAVYRSVDKEFVAPFLFGFRWLSEYATEWDYLHEPDIVPQVPSREEIAAIVDGQRAPVPTPEGLG